MGSSWSDDVCVAFIAAEFVDRPREQDRGVRFTALGLMEVMTWMGNRRTASNA